MKLYLIFIFVAFSLTTISSCKKTDNIENAGIIGKWELKEMYNGYANGGNYSWNTVSVDNSHTLTFRQNGEYYLKQNVNGNNQECFGTYILQPSNNLEITSSCNSLTEKGFISELTPTLLILDRSGIERVIRYKYSASK